MMNLFKKIPKINLRKPTTTQVVIGIIAIIVVLALLRFLINLAATLLPIALFAIVAYVVFQQLSANRDDNSKSTADAKASDTQASDNKTPSLRVSDKINPKTGLREPDMERLLAEEERAQQKEADAEVIRRQIEERKKRLMNKD